MCIKYDNNLNQLKCNNDDDDNNDNNNAVIIIQTLHYKPLKNVKCSENLKNMPDKQQLCQL